MPVATSGLRSRAYLDPVLQEVLPRWIGAQRVIYNGKVAEDRLFAAQRRLALRAAPDTEVRTPLDQQYAQFKDRELTPWLFEVPSQVLRNGAYRWYTAKQRHLKGLAQAPRLRKRHDFNSVLLTDELFRFVEVVDRATGELRHDIELGTEAKPIGRLRFRASQPYVVPKTLVLRRVGSGRWYVSFCFEHETAVEMRAPHELAYELNALTDEALAATTLAFDRNVRDNCLADSAGRHYGLSAVQQERLARKAVNRKRYQRKLARQAKGSMSREKTKRKIAKSHEYSAHVRRDFAHQVSHQAVAGEHRLFVFEALNIRGMTRRPRAKQDAAGKWLRNNARAKAGLNTAILASAWRLTQTFVTYKAARCNKLALEVPAAYSSQECSRCGHTHPDNRHGARFVCLRCGWTMHADDNAARVIKGRGLARIRSGELEALPKPKKRVAFRRKSKTGEEYPGVSVEPCISRPPPHGCADAAGVEAETQAREGRLPLGASDAPTALALASQ